MRLFICAQSRIFSQLLAIEMFAERAHFRRAFRNLIQRTRRQATGSTEGPMQRKMSTRRKEKGLFLCGSP